MNDQELNEKLAEVLGYEVFIDSKYGSPVVMVRREHESWREFSYKSDAIFAECVEWLWRTPYIRPLLLDLDNEIERFGYADERPHGIVWKVSSDCPRKAAALARIKAGED